MLYQEPQGEELTLLPTPEGILVMATRQGVVRGLRSGEGVEWEVDLKRPNNEVPPKLGLLGGRVLLAFDAPELVGLDLRKGAVVWLARFPQGGRMTSPFSVFAERLFVGTDTQILYVFAEEAP